MTAGRTLPCRLPHLYPIHTLTLRSIPSWSDRQEAEHARPLDEAGTSSPRWCTVRATSASPAGLPGSHHSAPPPAVGRCRAGGAGPLSSLALAAYDRMTGRDLDELAVDGRITATPRAGKRPAARRWIGASRLERSVLTEAQGRPVHLVSGRSIGPVARCCDPGQPGQGGPAHLRGCRRSA